MNERLEQEIKLWKHKRCSYDERGDIFATAQHFYNLALEDVRKEVEKQEEIARTFWNEHCDGAYMGAVEMCGKIKENIDNLTK